MSMNWIGWTEFHHQLDIALTLWIEEGGIKEMRLPSHTNLMDFAKYTNEKRMSEIQRLGRTVGRMKHERNKV